MPTKISKLKHKNPTNEGSKLGHIFPLRYGAQELEKARATVETK